MSATKIVTGFRSVIPDKKTGALKITLKLDEEWSEFTVPSELLGPLIFGLVAMSKRVLDNKRFAEAGLPLTLSQAGPIFWLDDGRLGVNLTLENGVVLGVVVPDVEQAVAAFRGLADSIDRAWKEGPRRTSIPH